MSDASTPLLSLERARIDADGAVLLDGLTLRSQGDQLGLVGDWQPLFAVFGGGARVASGSVRVRGLHPLSAVRQAQVGFAPADPPLPEAWTARDYLAQSAELAGLSPRVARAEARWALAELGLAHLELRRLGTLTVAEKRAVVVAHALLARPGVLVLEAPLARLDHRSAEQLDEALMRAANGRSLIASVPLVAPVGAERALLDRLGEVAVLEAGMLVAHGAPESALGSGTRYAVTVTRQGAELASRLGEQGMTAALAPGESGRARLVVELGPGATTDELLDAALAVGAPIIELVPLAGESTGR